MQRADRHPHPAIASSSVTDLIGRTPLLRLDRFLPPASRVEIYAKAEFLNPGGSVKDRAAAAILRRRRADAAALHARRHDPRRHVRQHRHRLRDDRRGARLQAEAVRAGQRHRRAQADAARVRRGAGADRARWRAPTARSARRGGCSPDDPGRYFYADQYNNDANWRAHYDTTGAGDPRADGRAAHALRRRARARAARSSGVGRRLREHNRDDPADLGAARLAAARRSKGSSTWRRRSGRASTIRRWRTRTCGFRPSGRTT